MKATTLYSNQRWYQYGPFEAGIKTFWDTWRMGIRGTLAEMTWTGPVNWWSIEIKATKIPRSDD